MFNKIVVAIIGCALMGLSVVMGCSSGKSPAPANSNSDQVVPSKSSGDTDTDSTLPISACDKCFKTVPVEAICAADVSWQGYRADVSVMEQAEAYAKFLVDFEDPTASSVTYVVSLTPYDPSKDTEYAVVKSEMVSILGETRECITEFRYRDLDVKCEDVVAARVGHDTVLSLLQQIAP